MSKDLLLQLWLSPAFPIGAFAYSHGLEAAVEAGDIFDAGTLKGWLADLCRSGGPWNDGVLFAEAHRAAARGRWPDLIEINDLAIALAGSSERRLETTQQGGAFLATAGAAFACQTLIDLKTRLNGDACAYPIAAAAAAAGHGVRLETAIGAFMMATLSNLTSAAVRLSVVGQTDGQRVLSDLLPLVVETSAAAADGGMETIGGAAFRSDLASLAHETQYSRLFRS